MNYSNISIKYAKDIKKIGDKLSKEIKRFVSKYRKILALDKQKNIEINLIKSDNLSVSVTNRLINIKIVDRINIDSVSSILFDKIINILEKDKVFIPDYIKEQSKGEFDINKRIELNKNQTKDIMENISKE